MRHILTRCAAAAATVALGVGLFAAVASAHVTVNPNSATKGGFAKLTFRVPTEKDDASTTKVEVAFPTDHPLASVSVKPHAGWTADVKTTHLDKPIKSDDGDVADVVSGVTWTATSADTAIKPGQFDEFDISVGPLPTDADKLVFKALQTYSNGDVVHWIDEATAGGAEPAHPAPTLTLTAAAKPDSATPTSAPAAPASASAAPAATTTSTSKRDSSKGLAVAALIVAIIGVLLGGFAAVRSAKRGPTT